MQAQSTSGLTYINNTESFMRALKTAIRSSPNFAAVSSESELEHRTGVEHARGAVYRSTWELQGPNGTVTVDACFANDFGCSLVTQLTLKPLGTASAKAVFGQEGSPASSTENVEPVLNRFINIIANQPANPFASVRMPAAS